MFDTGDGEEGDTPNQDPLQVENSDPLVQDPLQQENSDPLGKESRTRPVPSSFMPPRKGRGKRNGSYSISVPCKTMLKLNYLA